MCEREKAEILLVVPGKLWYFEAGQWNTLIRFLPLTRAQNCSAIKIQKNQPDVRNE